MSSSEPAPLPYTSGMAVDRDSLIAEVESATRELERVQDEARRATNEAARKRGQAIARAVKEIGAQNVADALGLSVQRVYKLVRDSR